MKQIEDKLKGTTKIQKKCHDEDAALKEEERMETHEIKRLSAKDNLMLSQLSLQWQQM